MRGHRSLAGSLLGLFALLAGCGQVHGSGNMAEPDAPGSDAAGPPADDASAPADVVIAADAAIPATVKVTGTALDVIGANQTPCMCEVDFIAADNVSQVGRANSDAQGNYTATLTTKGAALALNHIAVLDAGSSATFGVSFSFAGPLVADRRLDFKLFDANAIESLEQLGGVTPTTPSRLMIVRVLNASGAALGGATVTLVPTGGTIVYTDGTGKPVPSTIQATTAADGLAYVFDPPSSPNVSAAAPGLQFTPRKVATLGRTTSIAELAP